METAVFLCLRKSILYCYRLQAVPPRPALNSSRCLLLPALIRESEKRQGEERERERETDREMMGGEEERGPGHNELYVEECGGNITAVQLIPELYQLQSGSTQR